MSARALVDLGSLEEAEALLRWVDGCIDRTGGHPERLHPLYTVEGLELGPEAVIDTLPGYAGSRPVRVGNAANRQIQLDVFGPITDLVAAVAQARGSVRNADWRVVEEMVQAVERRWHEPDHGIWEARLPPRHHVYSKVMCWLTVDEGARRCRRSAARPRIPTGSSCATGSARTCSMHGWNDAAGAYSVAYGDEDIDASSLWVGLSGLVSDDDPRFLATVLKVEAELRSGAVVYRYRWDDGLPGVEGGFHICTAWLVEAYLRTGPARRRGGAVPADARDGRARPGSSRSSTTRSPSAASATTRRRTAISGLIRCATRARVELGASCRASAPLGLRMSGSSTGSIGGGPCGARAAVSTVRLSR